MSTNQALPKEERGFTMLELLLVVGISSIIMSGLVMALYQMNRVTRLQHDSLTANHQIQSASVMLNRDVVGAVSGSVSGSTLTLAIDEHTAGSLAAPTTHTVTYTYDAGTGRLTRQEDGQSTVVASNLSSVSFTWNATSVEVGLTSDVNGEERSTTLLLDRRPLQQ
ncbi:MAG: PulJ/GspJ family protein [Anaerolineae bacterium]